MEVKIEIITPEKAREYLKMNTHNRRVDRSHVEFIKRLMSKGQWIQNGDTIRISLKNVLFDGQHRLIALSELENVSFPFIVVTGLDDIAMNTIDCNCKKRTAADYFELAGIKNANICASIVSQYCRLLNNWGAFTGGSTSGNCKSIKRYSIQEMVDVYFSYDDLIADIVPLARKIYNDKRLITKSDAGGTMLYLIAELGYDFDFVKKFFEEINDLNEGNAAGLLGKILLKDKIMTNKLTSFYKSQIFIKAWNYYVNGKEVKILKYDFESEGKLKFIANTKLNLK